MKSCFFTILGIMALCAIIHTIAVSSGAPGIEFTGESQAQPAPTKKANKKNQPTIAQGGGDSNMVRIEIGGAPIEINKNLAISLTSILCFFSCIVGLLIVGLPFLRLFASIASHRARANVAKVLLE